MIVAAFASCDKIDEIEGMNDQRAEYGYRAVTYDFNYDEAAGPFDSAIREVGCWEPVMGGADDKVIDICDRCYEQLKSSTLQGRNGKVLIMKIRHPDGKQKVIREYKFE